MIILTLWNTYILHKWTFTMLKWWIIIFFLSFSAIFILIIIESCTCENFTMLRLSIVVVDNSRHIFPFRHLPIRCYLIVDIYQFNNNSGRRHTSTIFKFHLFSSLKLSQSIEFHPISMANFQRCLNKRSITRQYNLNRKKNNTNNWYFSNVALMRQ